MLHSKRHRLFWLGTLAMVTAGFIGCLATDGTAAHGLTLLFSALFLAGTVHLTDVFLPSEQPREVRRLSAGVFAVGWALLVGFYLWHFQAAETVYVNDQAIYYYQQLTLETQLQSGLRDTLRHVYSSLRTDYTCIPNLLLAPLFSLTDRSIDGFSLSVVLLAWTPLMMQLRRITLRLADRLGLSQGGVLLLCAGVCVGVMALPLLHRAAAWRQVNLLGVPLLVLVVALSLGADFRRWEPGRLVALFFSAVLLALLRRWFLFFLAGWLPLWGVVRLVALLRQREGKAALRLLLYGGLGMLGGALLLCPLLTRAVGGNYAVSYAYWRKEGSSLLYELKNQSWLLGFGSCGLIAAGYLWGLLQRRSRDVRLVAALTLGSAAISLLLFTRIQNMTYHQATILMPAYVLGLMLFFAMAATLPKRGWQIGLTAVTCAALIFQWSVSVTRDRPQDFCPLLAHTSLKPPVRDDLDVLLAVADFVDATCTAEHPALILMNDGDYDRLTFVTPRYPDLGLREKVALDRIALPSDGFPRAWFSARYILVPTTPRTNQPGGTVEKLTHYLLTDESDRFETVGTFHFDGFDLLVMQRKGPVEYAEVEEMMALFQEEHAQYPLVWGERIGFFYGLTQ